MSLAAGRPRLASVAGVAPGQDRAMVGEGPPLGLAGDGRAPRARIWRRLCLSAAGSRGMSILGDDPFDALIECANCGGDFLPEDMDGEHCCECAEELFGGVND